MGVSPTNARNREENDPTLANPTSMQISVTVRFAARNRSHARSIRRRVRYRIGVSPYAVANDRMKWYFDTPATVASSARSRGSA